MENRVQHIFLKVSLLLAALLVQASAAWANTNVPEQNSETSEIRNEVFELGVTVGWINIADFNSETTLGLSATFTASEDFFLQYNYFQADASASSYESSQTRLFDGKDRTFRHFDLLVGYNLFQGEFFPTGPRARLSALYLVGGVGDTQFGGESSFSYTAGIGYQLALTRRFILRMDYRSYIYTSNLITDEDKTVISTQLSSGLSYLF